MVFVRGEAQLTSSKSDNGNLAKKIYQTILWRLWRLLCSVVSEMSDKRCDECNHAYEQGYTVNTHEAQFVWYFEINALKRNCFIKLDNRRKIDIHKIKIC